MEPIRRPKSIRMSKVEAPARDADDEKPTLRIARGTQPHVKLKLDDALPTLGTTDITTIVHELRNPLAAISLEACLLEATSDSENVKRVLQRIATNVTMLERVVNELADVAAMQQDKLALSRRSNEMRSLIIETIDRSLTPRERARIFIEAPPACLANVDGVRIERVILTLVRNALRLSARSSAVVVRLESIGDLVRISVIDAGQGLSASEATFSFESTLVMNMCRRIVEAHGGRVGVDSQIGVGTRFYFELPMSGYDDRIVAPPVAPLEVLLVDDDARQLEALAEVLRREGLIVTAATNGSAALAGVRSRPIDLAIVDVELPDVHGPELVAQLRHSSPNLPVIVVSGHPIDSRRVVEMVDVCRGPYISKPIDVPALLAQITLCASPRD